MHTFCRVGCLGGVKKKKKERCYFTERTKKALAFVLGGMIKEEHLGGEETPTVESL